MTPYFERDGITIYCGDNVEVLSQLEQGSIDLTVTSPPYDDMDDDYNPISKNGLREYNGYTWDFKGLTSQLWRVTMGGGVVVWVVGDVTNNGSESLASSLQKIYFRRTGFNLHDTMIYFKDCVTFPDTNRYHPSFEYMLIVSKNTPKTTNLLTDRRNKWGGTFTRGGRTERYPDGSLKNKGKQFVKDYGLRYNVWTIQSGYGNSTKDDNAYTHPAIFPEALARDHIISWSNEGDLVCDPFLGSGTTAKMAQQLGRRFVGCDISEEYCQIAVDRLRQPSFFSLPTMKQPESQPIQEALWRGENEKQINR